MGRKAGAIARTLAPKEVEGEIRPHLKGSTYQLDLIDFRSLGAVSGFAMVAVDVGTRKVYGALMADKSVPSIIAAFEEITGGADVSSILAPSLIDTDQERGWTGSPQWENYLVRKGIAQRYKTDRFAKNNLGMVDNAIARIKKYIRRKLTEEDLDGDAWEQFFEEAVSAQGNRRYEVLYRQTPNELFDNNGQPRSEDAEHTIFALEQEQAGKLKKNKDRKERLEANLAKAGAFRIPLRLSWDKNVMQASHSGEVHGIAGFENSRVVSARDGKAYPMATVAVSDRDSLDVRLPPRLQRRGRLTQKDQRQILQDFVPIGRDFLRPRANQEAPIEEFDAMLRAEEGYAEALQEAGFRNPPGNPFKATQKFVNLFGDFELTNRQRTVFLQADDEDETDDDDKRPRIDLEYQQAVEEVRDFDEYYDDDEEYQRAVEEVRAFPEFDEF